MIKTMNCSVKHRYFVYALLLLTIFSVISSVVKAQNEAAGNSNQTNVNAADVSVETAPTPIPFSEIVAQTQSAGATLEEIAAGAADDSTTAFVERELPALTAEIDARLAETARIVNGRPSLENLRNFESGWRTLTKDLPDWKKNLTTRARTLESDLTQIDQLEEKWKKTLTDLNAATNAPPELTASITEIISNAEQTRTQIGIAQTGIVALQSRVAEQQKRVASAVESLKQTRESLVGQLLVQDSPTIWSDAFWTRARVETTNDTNSSIAAQFVTLSDFAGRNFDRIAFQLLVFLAFAGVLIFLRRRTKPWVEKEPDLKKAAIIFYLPISTALILAIIFGSWIYPQKPQILSAIFGAIALLPTVFILRKIIERPLYPLLYSLVIFYFTDQWRTVTEPIAAYARLILLAEMLGGFAFFLWLYYARLSQDETEKVVHSKIFRTIKIAALIALPIFAVSLLANIFGYYNLARLLGNAVLRSAYAAVILYAAVRILDGLLVFALRFRPLNLLGMVQNNRQLIQIRLRKTLRFLAFILWIYLTLELLSLREPLYERTREILNATLTLGSISISLGDVLLFGAVVWAAFLLVRFANFVLEEDVYPRFSLERGIPYAISTMLRYVILLLGFFLAVAAVGFDLTKFTILAGAFGVGIGFGLQNIINNFVSGLILLFERPVKVGDVVKVADATGTVRRIGIRASLVQTWDDAEIIVPNSKLISESVTNWTFSTQQRGIEIPVSVAYGTDPRFIIERLSAVLAKHPLVAEEPAPKVFFVEFGADSLNFKARAWTTHGDKWFGIRSDLAVAINEALVAENISIPTGQNDVHIAGISNDLAQALEGSAAESPKSADVE